MDHRVFFSYRGIQAIWPAPKPPFLCNQLPFLQLLINTGDGPVKEAKLPSNLFADPRITLRESLPSVLIHQDLIHVLGAAEELLRHLNSLETFLVLRLLLLRRWHRSSFLRRRRDGGGGPARRGGCPGGSLLRIRLVLGRAALRHGGDVLPDLLEDQGLAAGEEGVLGAARERGLLAADGHAKVGVLIGVLVGKVGNLGGAGDLDNARFGGCLGLPGEGEGELVPRNDLALADVDVGLAVELVERGGADGEAALGVEDGEAREQRGEPCPRPLEAVALGPVPVVHVGAVGALLHDPPLVALAVLCHGLDEGRR
jgi:hypothetical protein